MSYIKYRTFISCVALIVSGIAGWTSRPQRLKGSQNVQCEELPFDNATLGSSRRHRLARKHEPFTKLHYRRLCLCVDACFVASGRKTSCRIVLSEEGGHRAHQAQGLTRPSCNRRSLSSVGRSRGPGCTEPPAAFVCGRPPPCRHPRPHPTREAPLAVGEQPRRLPTLPPRPSTSSGPCALEKLRTLEPPHRVEGPRRAPQTSLHATCQWWRGGKEEVDGEHTRLLALEKACRGSSEANCERMIPREDTSNFVFVMQYIPLLNSAIVFSGK